MNPNTDKRTVLTLDAGGTNLVFNAIQANQEIIEPVILPTYGDELQKCIDTISEGFKKVIGLIKEKPVAISFAFPGPSDYSTGIVGKLNNIPAFTGGIPLGPILENRFRIPVFINNDGDLFAYGEAISGFLPYVNNLLQEAGIQKKYRNLIGLTLGTGFGGGFVCNQELIKGDNSMGGEVWLIRNRINPATHAEEGISIRAIQRVYVSKTGIDPQKCPSPKEIYEIALGKQTGNKKAALEAFEQLGIVLGDVLGNLITVIDGVAVIGGGLSGAMPLIFPAMIKELESNYSSRTHGSCSRLVQKVFNINDVEGKNQFLKFRVKQIKIPGTSDRIKYYPEAHIPIGTSMIGTHRAVSSGAYAYALKML